MRRACEVRSEALGVERSRVTERGTFRRSAKIPAECHTGVNALIRRKMQAAAVRRDRAAHAVAFSPEARW